jgi:predicted flavoprotein YhiN
MNARRTGKKVRKFDTYNQLRNYTKDSGKIYPKRDAKGDVVKVLLSKWRTRATVNVKITFTFSTREVHTHVSRFRMRTLLGP